MFNKILVATDFSRPSKAALHAGLEMAKKLLVPLHIVSVITLARQSCAGAFLWWFCFRCGRQKVWNRWLHGPDHGETFPRKAGAAHPYDHDWNCDVVDVDVQHCSMRNDACGFEAGVDKSNLIGCAQSGSPFDRVWGKLWRNRHTDRNRTQRDCDCGD